MDNNNKTELTLSGWRSPEKKPKQTLYSEAQGRRVLLGTWTAGRPPHCIPTGPQCSFGSEYGD